MDMTSPQTYCAQIATFLRGSPGAWTQGTNARDERGHQCDPRSAAAIRWCAAGLVLKFVTDERSRILTRALLVRTITRPGYPPMSVEQFNDQQTKVEPVIQMFEAASHLPELTPPRPSRTWFGFVSDGVPMPFTETQVIEIPDWLKLSPSQPQMPIPNWGQLASTPSSERESVVA